MSNTTVAKSSAPGVTHADPALNHVVWGLALFIAGFLTGYIPILHYMNGAMEGNVGPDFLRNITLWWGCPAVLPELALKTGGLGMVAIGLCYIVLVPRGGAPAISSSERLAPALCAFGLVAELLTAGVGYVVCNYFWPNFYYAAVPAGKNVWLAAQGFSIAFYVAGTLFSFAGIRRISQGWARDAAHWRH